jgi:hypothetical protein
MLWSLLLVPGAAELTFSSGVPNPCLCKSCWYSKYWQSGFTLSVELHKGVGKSQGCQKGDHYLSMTLPADCACATPWKQCALLHSMATLSTKLVCLMTS